MSEWNWDPSYHNLTGWEIVVYVRSERGEYDGDDDDDMRERKLTLDGEHEDVDGDGDEDDGGDDDDDVPVNHNNLKRVQLFPILWPLVSFPDNRKLQLIQTYR